MIQTTEGMIWVSAHYGYNTRKPYVEIFHEEKNYKVQLDVAAARSLGRNLLEVAAVAEQDAFMFEFFSKSIEEKTAAAILVELRKWRDDHQEVE